MSNSYRYTAHKVKQRWINSIAFQLGDKICNFMNEKRATTKIAFTMWFVCFFHFIFKVNNVIVLHNSFVFLLIFFSIVFGHSLEQFRLALNASPVTELHWHFWSLPFWVQTYFHFQLADHTDNQFLLELTLRYGVNGWSTSSCCVLIFNHTWRMGHQLRSRGLEFSVGFWY